MEPKDCEAEYYQYSFLTPPPHSQANSLAFLHFRRNLLLPVYLSSAPDAIESTRFGCYPHSVLLSVPWGSQILAKHVRGKLSLTRHSDKIKTQAATLALVGRKRTRDCTDNNTKLSVSDEQTGFTISESTNSTNSLEIRESTSGGFCHILAPTPELWTLSLPHRTQVVYTPDYSYILAQLKVRSGSRIIEAGAGSGSFTHAAARAVFSGYGNSTQHNSSRQGKVFSYEFHPQRTEMLRNEILAHKLDDIVTITHQDVCEEGFCIPVSTDDGSNDKRYSPRAHAIFLDLPSPWLALPKITRKENSPLHPRKPVHVCSFLPCIEQVLKTIKKLRELGFVDIRMSEIMHRRIEVRREYSNNSCKPSPNMPVDVGEALNRLNALTQEREQKILQQKMYFDKLSDQQPTSRVHNNDSGESKVENEDKLVQISTEKPSKTTSCKSWAHGRLVHRCELEWKSHTSYLVFAVLPVEWTENDELNARQKWPLKSGSTLITPPSPKGESLG